MTKAQREKLLNSLVLAPEREARQDLDRLDVCQLCERTIQRGDWYRDRGKYRRAHSECVRRERPGGGG